MKKLLFVILSLKCGGAERSLINLLNELSPEKYDIDLLLFRRTGDFLKQVPGHVHILDTPDDLKKLFGPVKKAGSMAPVKAFGTLMGRVFDGKPQNGRMMFRWNHFYKKVLSKLPGSYDAAVGYLEGESTYYICDFVNAKKKIAWIHSDYSHLGNRAQDDLAYFRQMDAIVTISNQCQNVLQETFPQMKSKVLMLENITSSSAIRKQAEGPAPDEFEDGVFTIVSVGRLAPEKGFDTAVEAASILRSRQKSFKWLIVGEGAMRESLEQQIDKLDLQNYVHLLGIKTNPYIYMKNSDLLVQPSRFEGKSIVVDEAKMLGVPVLITNYSTAKDQISDGENGWIVDMNAAAVADGVLHAIDDPLLLSKIHDFQLAHNYDNLHELKKYEDLFDN